MLFLFEERTESYIGYDEGVQKKKIAYDPKNASKFSSFAHTQVGLAHRFRGGSESWVLIKQGNRA